MSHPDPPPPPEHGDRYDHRTADQREEDAAEDTMDAPIQDGAAELRAATEAALQAGEAPHDPADPRPGPHPPAR